ncbi:unnamed protein product [Bursaphelenchus okinawaensis]|uniref:Carboxylesterase type B domain-containing protein n=1 Tax=Bursaphelenchus okinawaensis TaxID=465554 RepID=A0A811LKB5_9BILA|nr:unnamed protein product [Bursaphelenchus okinawaensis]CAG9125317.1 unnamed protein product [Bursaphelenchus okinawaensis]
MPILILVFVGFVGAQFSEPRRPVDLWNPFGTTTTRRPGQGTASDEVLVRLSIGHVIGRRATVYNVPWTADKDPLETERPTASHFDPDPVPLLNNVTVYTFLGIPYAEPPVSQRRFKPPQLMTQLPGEGPFSALEYGPTCAQEIETRPNLKINNLYPFRVSEDCLYLNIFTPDAAKTSSRNYPVVAFFHGGNFQTGSANEWPGHVLASRGLVVVTINYRLGPFGFMSLGDTYTGNYGIQDQRCALQWIQQHIAAFGGNPGAVSIVGHDAGAVSAGIHMLSPLSKGLFKAVVAMSGAEVSYHSTIGKPILAFNNTMKLGRYLGCVQPVAQQVWDCILTRSTNDIIQAVSPTNVPTIPVEFNRYLFMPTIDNRELSSHPLLLLNEVPTGGADLPSPVPYLTGLNKHDGVEAILENRPLGEFSDFEVDESFMRSWIIEYTYRHNYTMNRESIIAAISDYYTFWPDKSDIWNIRDKFIELVTDAYYTAPIAQSTHLHSAAGSRTFMYVNSYNFSETRDNREPRESNQAFRDWMGSCHQCDLYLLFGFPYLEPNLMPKHLNEVVWYNTDRNASYLFSSMVRQFVRVYDPNLPNQGIWPAYQPRAHWFMNFTYHAFHPTDRLGTVDRDYRYSEVGFWNNLIPGLVNYMTTTFPPDGVVERRELVLFKIVCAILVIIVMLLLLGVLSCGYMMFDRRKGEDFDRRTLMTRQSDYHETYQPPHPGTVGPQRIPMNQLSSL